MPTLPKGKQRPWMPVRPSHLRDVDNSAFYNSRRWRSISKTFRKRNPLCIQCERDGNGPVPSQCVDHIKPISQYGMGVATDIKNLQALCNSCHAKKSGRESSEVRNTKVYDRNK
jgi:5-methylcytosine-specific restriction protein A